MRKQMESMIVAEQQHICAALSELDGKSFVVDRWAREADEPHGGGGVTCVLQDGNVFEKAGVGVSVVSGTLSPQAVAQMGGGAHLKDDDEVNRRFFAAGLSLVIHPHNPMAPTVHANYRYFERGDAEAPAAWWFGGGSDLTPAYLFEDDAVHFHGTLKRVCDAHDDAYYPRFKQWCDRYFLIAHRGERRGIGGIFFDDLHDRPCEALFAFVRDCAQAFVPSYVPLVQRRRDMPFTEAHKRWQQVRRGRYVEFNLVYDRGTVFGLKTAGRIESILMSLPLTARWEYGYNAERHPAEAALVDALRQPRDWVT